MSKCDNCRLRKESARAFDIHWHGQEDCPYDVCPEIKTNADRIRAMSDEELAKQLTWEQYAGIRTFLLGFDKELLEDFGSDSKKAWADSVQEKLEWLRQEVTE